MLEPTADRSQKYRRIAFLGEGGMARVFLALANGPAGFNKLFVVKELRPELVSAPESLRMFLDEARLSAQLNHANIVQTLEVVSEGDQQYIVMEYLEGKPLSRILSRIGRSKFPLEQYLLILCEVLSALQYAHEYRDYAGKLLNVVHRDISPDNIFVTYDGQVKLLDFGIAKASGRSEQTEIGIFKGKVAYAAPEQVLGIEVDRRVDIFSVGVILWEALTGRRLSGAGGKDLSSSFDQLQRRVAAQEERVLDVRPDAPPALVAVCERAMANEPGERFSTAAAFEQAIRDYIAQSSLPRISNRDLGASVSLAFQKERDEIRSLVEAKIATLVDGGQSFPSLDLADKGGSSISQAKSAASDFATAAPPELAPKKSMRWSIAALVLGLVVVTFYLGRGTRSPPTGAPTITPMTSDPGRPMASTAPTPTQSASELVTPGPAPSGGAPQASDAPSSTTSSAPSSRAVSDTLARKRDATTSAARNTGTSSSTSTSSSAVHAKGKPSPSASAAPLTGEHYDPQPLDDRK